MIQDIAPLVYDNHYEEREAREKDFALIFRKGEILLKTEPQIDYPHIQDLPENTELTYLFEISGERFFLVDYTDELSGLLDLGFEFKGIFAARGMGPKYLRFAGVTAFQLQDWYHSNRFCGRCGKPTVKDHKERMLKCPECGNTIYPKICPGVIVAVTNGDELLLTKYNRPGAVNYALVAGFTEIGETLEETVQREVMEEVGLKVRNIRYYKCQPWSFSSTLLCGFYCEVDGDTTIRLDREELAVGEWLKREDIPERTDDVSLTSEMINAFRDGKQ